MIDKIEFRQAVAAMGVDADRTMCDAIFDEYDADSSGEMAYSEYVRFSLRDARWNGSSTREVRLHRRRCRRR